MKIQAYVCLISGLRRSFSTFTPTRKERKGDRGGEERKERRMEKERERERKKGKKKERKEKKERSKEKKVDKFNYIKNSYLYISIYNKQLKSKAKAWLIIC